MSIIRRMLQCPLVLITSCIIAQGIDRSDYAQKNVWFAHMPFYDQAIERVVVSDLVLDMSEGYAWHGFVKNDDFIYLELYDLSTNQWLVLRFRVGKWELKPNHKPVKLENEN